MAAEGRLAVAPHLFHRTGGPDFRYDDMSQVMPHTSKLTADDVLADVNAALGRLTEAGIGAGRTGIVGFCMGSTVALVIAAHRDVCAAVSFYGGGGARAGLGSGRSSKRRPGCGPVARVVRRPRQGHPGGRRRATADLRRLLRPAIEVVRYPDAEHGFHCDRRPSYHRPSARDAWRRTLDWFDRHLAAS